MMSGANAISGIALVGALTLTQDAFLQTVIAFLAITFASINVFGGYLVTNRMLSMFKNNMENFDAALLQNIAYIFAAILFITGIGYLKEATAQKGNVISAVGMFLNYRNSY